MAENEFLLPGIDDDKVYEQMAKKAAANRGLVDPLPQADTGDETDWAEVAKSTAEAYEGKENEYALPGIDRPYGLETIKSVTELPSDLLARTGRHFMEGGELLKTGLLSVLPGTAETVWRGKQPDETTLQYLGTKFRPLGILGGPAEMISSPATAALSETARLGSELERGIRGLGPREKPYLQYLEEHAAIPATLATGFAGPARRGLASLFFGPGHETAAQASRRIVERAAKGHLPTEMVLRQLEKYAPSAKAGGAALRESQAAKMKFSSMLREEGGLEEALLKLTPEQQLEYWERAAGNIPEFGTPEMRAFEQQYQKVFGAEKGLRPQLAEALGLRGKTLEGKTVPFTPQKGFYAPHVYEPADSRAIREALEFERYLEGKPITVHRDIVFGDNRPFIASAAHARNPAAIAAAQNYIKDVPRAVLSSIEDFSATLGRARAFGPQGEKLDAILRNIAEEIGGPDGVAVSKQLYDAIARDLGPGAARSIGLDSMRVLQAITKMPFSFISNATQSFITAVVAGAKNTTQAMAETLWAAATRGELPSIVKELGIINRTTAQALQHEISGAAPGFLQKTANVVLKPFEWVERLNQTVAARAGELATERLSKKLASSGKLDPREWRWLRNSDIDIDAVQQRIASKGGGLLRHEVQRASWGLLDRTQFLARPTAMPYVMRSTPLMRMVFQMKTFAARASEAILNEVGREAVKGNMNPALRLLAYYPIGGELAKQLGRRARGQEVSSPKEVWNMETQDKIKRGLHNMLYVGGLGIATDLAMAISRGGEAVGGFLLGPGINDVVQEATGMFEIGQHAMNLPRERKKLEAARGRFWRRQTRRIPFFGPTLSEEQKTPKQKRQTQREKAPYY